MKHGIDVLVVAGFRPRVTSPVSGIVLSWSLLLTLILFQLFHGHGFDDPYITYRYAANLAHGDGFVYNQGVRVLSTTTPLYTLILTPVAWLGLDLPLASNALGCLSLALGGVAFWVIGRLTNARWAGLTGLLLYPIGPLLLPTLGAESALYCTLILWGCVWYMEAHYTRAAILLSLALLTRADGVLIVGILFAHWLMLRRGRVPWRALLIGAVLTLPWFVWSWWYFSAPLPVTLLAKQHQGQLPHSIHFFAGFIVMVRNFWHQPLYRLYGLLALVGAGYGGLRQRSWLIVLLWNLLYLIAYNALGVTNYFWYYAPLAAGGVALVALGVEAVGVTLARISGRLVVSGVVISLVLLLLLAEGLDLRRVAQHPDRRLVIYRHVGEWLRANTVPGSTIGTLEVGIIGFYSQRPMIDFAGLLQPETAYQLGPTTSYEDAALWAAHHFQPQYVVVLRGSFARLVQPAGDTPCQPIKSFSDPAYPGSLDVYQCPPGAY